MKKELLTTLAVLIGALLFNLIFWNEKMGLNTFIFAIFLVATLWFLNKESFSERTVQIATAGVLLSAALVVLHNSLISKWIHILTIPILVGFVQSRELKFIGLAFMLYCANLLETPRHFFNELKNLPILRGLGFAWVAQNAFLALSVGCRNWQYIDHCGLAYKRLGVFIFLLLTLIGLYFMYLKIKEKRSFFFVMRRVGWGFYGVLLAACFVNWDVFITRYNIETPVKTGIIDVRFLLNDISAKNLPLLFDNKEVLKRSLPQNLENYTPLTGNNFETILTYKKDGFISEQSHYSWLSFNYTDNVVKQYFHLN